MYYKVSLFVLSSLTLLGSIAHAQPVNELECTFRGGKGNRCTATLARSFAELGNTAGSTLVEGPYTVICNGETIYEGEAWRNSSVSSNSRKQWGGFTVFARDESDNADFPILNTVFVTDAGKERVEGPATLYLSKKKAITGRCNAIVSTPF